MNLAHVQRIRELEAGQFAQLEKIPAGGSLEARKLRGGLVMFYWRRTRGTKTERFPLGHYDSSAPPKALRPTSRGYSVAAALEAAREAAKRDNETPGGLRAERERQAAAEAVARAERERAQKFTLKALCAEYVDWLKLQKKSSHLDVENIFKNHVVDAYPDMATKSASDVTKAEIVAALRRLVEAGKRTTARKLRAYLRAAYACAVKADSDPNLPKRFADFRLTSNPVEHTAASKVRSDKNPLSLPDLRKYWQELKNELGVVGAALRLHLLSGGQRPAQLARLRAEDVREEVIKLRDGKGKRATPREHLVPITKPVRQELGLLCGKGWMLSTDGGITSMHPTSLSTWSQEVAARAGIPEFQLKRVRSGIETALAAAGVPKHDRGQLQSHGIGGVQDEHYDAYEYLSEKRRALLKLHQLLELKPTARAPRHSPDRTSITTTG